MFTLTKSHYVDFAHVIEGHGGACLNIHGHTWKFEVTIGASALDAMGMVVDFKRMRVELLDHIFKLLDHSLCLSDAMHEKLRDPLTAIWQHLQATRKEPAKLRTGDEWVESMLGARHANNASGMKIAVMPFAPTSERLADWFFRMAEKFVAADKDLVSRGGCVVSARVYETLVPVEAYAEARGNA